MTQKKNKFLTLCFSLIPGAAQMYMGFMKMGISLFALFAVSATCISVLHLDILSILCAVLWVYSFFHALNLMNMPTENFYNVEDAYLFHVFPDELKNNVFIKGYRKVLACIFIFLGIMMTWDGILDAIYDYLPQSIYHVLNTISYSVPNFLIGIAIIAAGVFMIRGKKEVPAIEEEK